MLKKESEKIILEKFRKIYADFPKGRLVVSESPDFIFRTRPRYAIGIELVGLSLPGYTETGIIHELSICIAAKNDKLPLYRRKSLDRYWLLIYTRYQGQVPENKVQSIQEFPPDMLFDKVFIFRERENNIIVLK